MSRPSRAARTAATAVGLLVASALAACTGAGPDPEDTAAELAAALQSGTLPEALFAEGSPQEQYDDLVAGLGDVDPVVEVRDVTTADAGSDGSADSATDSATATLTWSWDLGEATWSYESQARLSEAEDDAEDGTGWVVTWAPDLVEPSLGADELLTADRVPAPRAPVLGARGQVLVKDRAVIRVGIDKTRLPRARLADSARRLAATLDISATPYVRQVRSAGSEAFVEGIVLRRGDAQEATEDLSSIPGAVALPDSLPLAPTREFAAPLLGRVGQATAELVEDSDGRLRAGDETGLSGLQLRYDEQLSGTPGLEVFAVSSDATGPRALHRVDPVAGTPLRTTLDRARQGRAERVLAAGPSSATALVAVRPSDGAVLAAASGPGAEGLNAATFGQYPPGSTFKVVTALALLRSGLAPGDTLTCPGEVVVDGKRFENYDDYPPDRLGSVTLREALAHSCNTAFIGARGRIEDADLTDAAAALGFGVDHDLGFPAYFGQVPAATSRTEQAAGLIGQGTVLASPLTMASVAGSVQAGRAVVPHLLQDRRPRAQPTAPLTADEAEALRSMMRAVVTEGSGTVLASLPGAVGAKTGTAEYGEPGSDGGPGTHGWMIAYQGDLAVAAFVADGESGSSTAGPLLREFLSG